MFAGCEKLTGSQGTTIESLGGEPLNARWATVDRPGE